MMIPNPSLSNLGLAAMMVLMVASTTLVRSMTELATLRASSWLRLEDCLAVMVPVRVSVRSFRLEYNEVAVILPRLMSARRVADLRIMPGAVRRPPSHCATLFFRAVVSFLMVVRDLTMEAPSAMAKPTRRKIGAKRMVNC